MNPVRIGICGLGTVGSGTVNILTRNKALIDARAGCDITIVQIGARRDNPNCDTSNFNVTRDVFDVANNPEVDVLVEVLWINIAIGRVQDRNAGFREVPLYGAAPMHTRTLKYNMVGQFGIGDIHLAGHRVDRHVKENGTDAVVLLNRSGCQ